MRGRRARVRAWSGGSSWKVEVLHADGEVGGHAVLQPGYRITGAVPPAFPEGDSVRSARLTQQTCFSPGRWHRGSWVRPAPGHGQG